MLADCFLGKFSAATRRHFTSIGDDALAKLLDYEWPGNVRELANAIERAVVLGAGSVITAADLPVGLSGNPTMPNLQNVSYHERINAARKQSVLDALRQTNGSRAAAARLLGLEARYFLRLMKSLGIE